MDKRTGDGCHWVARDLCSACLTPAENRLVELAIGAGFMASSIEGFARMARTHHEFVQAMVKERLAGK